MLNLRNVLTLLQHGCSTKTAQRSRELRKLVTILRADCTNQDRFETWPQV